MAILVGAADTTHRSRGAKHRAGTWRWQGLVDRMDVAYHRLDDPKHIMRALRTTWRKWKGFLVGAGLLVMAAFCFYQVYCAWTYGVVRPIRALSAFYQLYCAWTPNSGCSGESVPSRWISYSAYPKLVVINLVVAIFAAAVLGFLVAIIFREWRIEQRNFRRRKSRPPLDVAVREPINR
jgi:hypothetical protein